MSKTPAWALLLAPGLATVNGLAYTFGDPQRTAAPSFDAAKSLFPMHVWGVIFLAGAVVCIIAIGIRNPTMMAAALWIGGLLYLWWAVNFAIAGLQSPQASLVAWAPYTVVVIFHWIVAYHIWVRRSADAVA